MFLIGWIKIKKDLFYKTSLFDYFDDNKEWIDLKKSDLFYKELPYFQDFKQSTQTAHYHIFPQDWWIVLTDVVNSTQAIEAGHYKEVNVVSVLAMTTLFNLMPKEIDVPFLFGGDGVTFFVPESLLPIAQQMIVINQEFAKETFDLEVRGHFLPVRTVYAQGYDLKIVKQRVSKRYYQACIVGNGIDFAEKQLKAEEDRTMHKLANRALFSPHLFNGFYCSFQDVNPSKEEMISLIVKSRGETIESQLACYQEVLAYLDTKMDLLNNSHPLQYEQLKISQEARVFALTEQINTWQRAAWFKKWFHWMLPYRQKLLRLLLAFLPKMPRNPQYETWVASDYRKIDGALKMTITCYQQERRKLETFLQTAFEQNKLYYGLHVNNKAFITCSVRYRDEVHLIDGSDGGYAFAAKHLKQQLQYVSDSVVSA